MINQDVCDDSGKQFFNLSGHGAFSTTSGMLSTTELKFERPFLRLESSRCYEAWIPNAKTQKLLNEQIETGRTEREHLTMPGICFADELDDTIKKMVDHYLGEAEATQRKVLSADDVTQDECGVVELIQAGAYRAAILLCGRLLTIYGQGVGKMGHVTKHTLISLHLWFTRIALLIKMGKIELAVQEAMPFGDLNKPDMFFQFYPDKYGSRAGSLAPFSFRVLLAELPMMNNRVKDSLARLYDMLSVITGMLRNLASGNMAEDGHTMVLEREDLEKSTRLWTQRKHRVYHALVNCFMKQRNYTVAIDVLKQLLDEKYISVLEKRRLTSTLGRVYLQLGSIPRAEEYFSKARELNPSQSPDLPEIIDQSLICVELSKYQEALDMLTNARSLDPTNLLLFNNISVCLLFMGKLDEAIATLEQALQANPTRGLTEHLLLNLSTLYGLQSSEHMTRKLKLLELISKYKADVGMNVEQCLKLNVV